MKTELMIGSIDEGLRWNNSFKIFSEEKLYIIISELVQNTWLVLF